MTKLKNFEITTRDGKVTRDPNNVKGTGGKSSLPVGGIGNFGEGLRIFLLGGKNLPKNDFESICFIITLSGGW